MAEPIKFILKPTIGAMYDILHMEYCKVDGIKGIPAVNKLYVSPEHFDLKFKTTVRAMHPDVMLENLPALSLQTPNATYNIPKYNAHFDGTIHMDAIADQSFDLRFSKLTQSTLATDQKYFWRFIYPVDSNEWFLKIDAYPYNDDYGTSHFRNLIICDLDGHKMNLFASKVDDTNWMIIESTEPVTYEEMDHRVMSLTIAMGFALGKRYGDYCFHVASDEPTFSQITGVEALALKETKGCPFRVLNHNNHWVELWLGEHDYQQYALDELKKQQTGEVRWYYNDDAALTMDAFSKLSQLCYTSNDMMLATSMLIDGTMMNIEYQKPFFHVALETITSSLMKGEKISLPPAMPQEQYQNDVVPVLLEALNKIPGLSAEALRVLTQRIEHNLNSAPNANKLEICFPKFGYTLSEADSEAIKKRNSTFHGHLSNDAQLLRNQYNDMLAMSLRLHKLCSILLLKAAGFSGKVLNNEVLFGTKAACERKEPVYIEI